MFYFFLLEVKKQRKDTDPKRDHTTFSKEQRLELERQFRLNRYPSRYHRGQLAQMLCLTEFQVKVWYQNRRMKYKRFNSALKFSDCHVPSCYCSHI